MPLGPPPNPVPVTPVYSETATRFHKKHKQIPLLLQAVQSNNFKIVKLLLNGNRPISITKHSILVALREAFELEMIEMCKVLIEEGNVRPTSDILQNLVSRAGMWRLLCGMRNKLSPAICFAVQKLSNDDFDHLSASLVRSAAEIGSVDFLQVCIERGADVNIWNGHALHASVYNGNLEVTTHLLKPEVNASTENFGSRQKAFCIGLMIIEGFALIMFSLLLFLWVAALVGYIEMKISDLQPNNGEMEIGNGTSTWWSGSTGKSGSSAQDVTLGELSGMALPSSLALLVMYRLVPLHKMCIAYSRVCKEDKRRRLELQRRREAEEIRQLTQIQNVESLE
ncbi:hypothetical protein BDR26DRAFT_685340 [Obelidium mucronatum]|nr:hypothetical protein BDR26DRAFT_685340 [Obelidium mucronatum]